MRYGLHIGGPGGDEHPGRARIVRPATCSTLRRTAPRATSAPSPIRSGSPTWGINLALTGQKSFHHLVPQFGFGVGVSKSNSSKDVGGYSFGTGFAIHFGGGLKFVHARPMGRAPRSDGLLLAALVSGRVPSAPTGSTPVLSADQAQNEWKQNATITFGISYIFSR